MYRVVWEIDIDAANAREAAELARAAQVDPDSIATSFDVTAVDDKGSPNGETVTVDLLDGESE
jgi:hypothetical protein